MIIELLKNDQIKLKYIYGRACENRALSIGLKRINNELKAISEMNSSDNY